MSIELIEAAAGDGTATIDNCTGTPLRTIAAPALGAYWAEQGGVYAGLVRGADGETDRHLIIATDPAGKFEGVQWGAYGKRIDGADSKHDGMGNTRAMAQAGNTTAAAVLALDIGGHKDWHIGSQADMHVAAANCPEAFDQVDYYWTSTQDDAHSAFCQGFEDGSSGWGDKRTQLRVRACRSIRLQPFND
jgi:hypothetical protein